MYENNYPNGAYHYEMGNTGNNMGQDYHTGPSKNKKSGSGMGKKIAVAICCGLCFGIFAGMGFWAVNTAGNFFSETMGSAQIKTIGEEADEQIDTTGETAASEVAEETAEEQEDKIAQTEQISAVVTDVTAVVKEVMPAVVSINNKYVEKMSFFGQEYSSDAQSTGSGIIVGQNDTELLIVSNHHVVDSAEELTVQFVDGTQVQAQTKGSDEDKDLAVIAVQLSDISSDTMNEIAIAKLGDSDALTVGEPVIAIGNALGYGQSVTTGVVSALNRTIQSSTTQNYDVSATDTEINTFIQTDAAINPGNSGGALLNIKGEVIGINSNKIGGSAIEGMGYAIPISDAKPIIENLMSKETRIRVDEDQRGYLGITGVDVRSDYSEDYGVPQGVYISSVVESSPADAAGLQRGYIITAINDEVVESMAELKEELAYYAAGDTVELNVMYPEIGKYVERTVSITLGAQSR